MRANQCFKFVNYFIGLGMLLLCTVAWSQAARDPYKIGIILPMTGPTADYGADFYHGAVLAEEEINASGGVNGRLTAKTNPKMGWPNSESWLKLTKCR